jgi:tetratricopeptide (TPR) repeat protein
MLARLASENEQWNRTKPTQEAFIARAQAAYRLGEPEEAMASHDGWVRAARLIPAKAHAIGAETPLSNALLNRYIALQRMGRPKQAMVDARELDVVDMQLISWLQAWTAFVPPFKYSRERLRAIRAAQNFDELLKNFVGDELQTRLQILSIDGLLASLAGDAEDAERAAAALWAFVDEDATSFPRDVALAVRAQTAWASGDSRGALSLLEQRSDGTPAVYRFFTAAWAGDRYLRAQALHALGRHSEALRWIESILLDANHMTGNFGDGAYFPGALLLRAQILESKGDGEAASAAYAWFAAQWNQCEPELQPIVDEARARIAALSREPHK